MNIGINLYSLHGTFDTDEKMTQTFEKLKTIGYDYVQFSGAPFVAENIKKIIDKTEMPVRITHVPMDRIIGDTDALIDEHLYIGCKNIGLGMMKIDFTDDTVVKENVEKLENAALRMENRGCKFFYHNHQFEFVRMKNGQTVLDYMVTKAPHINFTLDTYWVQYGGGDLYKYFEKLDGRMNCVHLKDYKIYLRDGKYVPGFAPLGDGTLDFKSIIPAMKVHGAENFIVEQDDAVTYDQPYEQLKKSCDYIKKEFN